MRALVYRGPGAMLVESRPIPELGPGEALLRMRACGICGTDLKIARGEHRLFPNGTVRVPGHELVGDVVLTADGSGPVEAGDRVVVAPNIACGTCAACRSGRANLCADYEAFGLTFDGGFAEFVRVPRPALEHGNLLPVPEDVDPAVLAMVEPLAAVLRGTAAVAAGGERVVVICGAGPIGLLHTMVWRRRGPERLVVSEPSPERRRQALVAGADEVVDPGSADLRERVLAVSGGEGADVVVVAVPVPALFEQAVSIAAIGGRVNFFAGLPSNAGAIGIDANLIHYRELVVTGTTANTLSDCRAALELLLAGEFDPTPLISARRPLAEAAAAFDQAASGEAMKVVIEA